ncbi:hypothetical protein [Fluoribacter gormanii]|uniref:Uncharacterized protein n=1 Tax=Fluoribacter gormanii TaxID=464 RepID=A0A377GNL5_9GAMM|nr:hypothetical protein [Fluoribacter gormanii]KTD00544.1 hypothetical protein Lgor_3020 [Fluoribacter gormanii]MCW8445275.1 hypothetical protein [Fluoribacter gormanii]SIR06800.1 hypothetical protein SAMN05421777_10637 [Fluoribacter gormanii]STO26378.1 Uncharacterised protein [Fluoribacter gormanii]
MKVDRQSIRELCGESSEVVVFGFGKYDYKKLCEAINQNDEMKAVHSDNYDTKNADLSKNNPYSMYNYFKFILNDLIVENYKKQKEGKPIVPLIFVVGKSDASYDPKQIAEREYDPTDKWVTLTELRRVYKLATEFGPEFSKVALNTVKFVSLETNSDVTTLKPVTPFWEDKNWQKEWQTRKEETKQTHGRLIKNSIWRSNLQEKIQEIDSQCSDEKSKEEKNTLKS